MSINKVLLTGNLTRDAQVKPLPSGTSVVEFGIAVNERVKTDGEWGNRANFFDCVWYGNRAESLAPHLSKGRKIALEGRLQYRAWEKDGQKRSKVDIVVNDADLMDNGKNVQSNVQKDDYTPPADQYDDSDIPF